MLTTLQKLATALRNFNCSSEIDLLVIYANQELKEGDEVDVINGTYKGVQATIVSIDYAHNLAIIEMNFFGRVVPKSIPISDLKLKKAYQPPQARVSNFDPNTDLETFRNYARKNPTDFMKQITPVFDELDDSKVKIVEDVIKTNIRSAKSFGLDRNEWLESFGKFLINYPEYLTAPTAIYLLELGALRGEEYLKPIPESLLLELFNQKDVFDNKESFKALAFNYQIFQKLYNIFPDFIGMLGFYIATHDPNLYLANNLDKVLHDYINKEDVVQNLFELDAYKFLQSPESGDHPELEKKAVQKLVYDSKSGPDELALFFTSPKQYWIKYPMWTDDAVKKMIYKYSDRLNFLLGDYALSVGSSNGFLDSEFGQELALKMAQHLIQNKNYSGFFSQQYSEFFPDLGLKFAEDLLDNGTDDQVKKIFDNYHLSSKYPSLIKKFYDRVKQIKKKPPETEEERNMRWEKEDLARQQEWERQQKSKKDYQDRPDIRNVEPDKDEDLIDYFPRGQ